MNNKYFILQCLHTLFPIRFVYQLWGWPLCSLMASGTSLFLNNIILDKVNSVLYDFFDNLTSHFLSLIDVFLFIFLAVPGLSCSMWDLVPWPGMELRPPALRVRHLSHWTTRKVPQPYWFLVTYLPWLWKLLNVQDIKLKCSSLAITSCLLLLHSIEPGFCSQGNIYSINPQTIVLGFVYYFYLFSRLQILESNCLGLNPTLLFTGWVTRDDLLNLSMP